MSIKLRRIEESIDKAVFMDQLNKIRSELDAYRRGFSAAPVAGSPELSRLYLLIEKKAKHINYEQRKYD